MIDGLVWHSKMCVTRRLQQDKLSETKIRSFTIMMMDNILSLLLKEKYYALDI